MAKAKLVPLDEQIAEYKLQFELYAELKAWQKDHPRPENGLNYDIEIRQWRADSYAFERSLVERGWWGKSWNWDEAHDGLIIERVQKLAAAGFPIVSFSRNRKITMRPLPEVSRATNVAVISNAVGDDWYSISFKPQLSIYWRGRTSNWH